MTVIRSEQNKDSEAIHEVNRLAFGQEEEALLVQRIRESSHFIPELSLVASQEGKIVGHILFSKIHIETVEGKKSVLSLAPMAIHPEFQNQGIGSKLVREGLKRCRNLGHEIVIVVGHPHYYPRFGFVPAGQKGLKAPFPVPDEAFMVLELTPKALTGIEGTVSYPPEFDEAT
jgi:putative acetyltransferase